MAVKTIPAITKFPQAGEQWDFKYKRKVADFDSRRDYPPAIVISVAEGWVRYGIGKTHPDLTKSLATFTYMYSRAPG